MSQRFFLREPNPGGRAELDGPEAHHLLHVMRAHVGDQVVLFDGAGCEYPGTVARLGRAVVELDVGPGNPVDRELPFRMTLGVALPKGDRQRWLLEKLVELGVTTCVPLRTVRGVAQFDGGAPERLSRAVIEAAKQCGRNRLMQIRPPMSPVDFFQSAGATTQRWIAHPPNDSGGTARPTVPRVRVDDDVWIAVGPEGGFTDEEVAVARSAGWALAGLGPRILRIETAALALVAALAAQVEWRFEG